MKNKKTIYLDFEVDRLINSIENAISGEVFDTLIVKLTDGKEIKKKMNGRSIGIMKLRIEQSKFINYQPSAIPQLFTDLLV